MSGCRWSYAAVMETARTATRLSDRARSTRLSAPGPSVSRVPTQGHRSRPTAACAVLLGRRRRRPVIPGHPRRRGRLPGQRSPEKRPPRCRPVDRTRARRSRPHRRGTVQHCVPRLSTALHCMAPSRKAGSGAETEALTPPRPCRRPVEIEGPTLGADAWARYRCPQDATPLSDGALPRIRRLLSVRRLDLRACRSLSSG